MATGAPSRRRVDGVLLLDKHVGLSSNAALLRAKWLYAAEKAGHTGTLDPLASGLLPVCFGDATKFAQSLLDSRKVYVAGIRFGIATTTGDAEGEVTAQAPVTIGREDIERALPRFTGTSMQVPPRHAALKFQGRKYYEYARAGLDCPRPPREVRIDAIELLSWASPVASIRVGCSKGTYIRVLAQEIGAALGCHAHLGELRRIETGPFTVDAAATLDTLAAMGASQRDGLLLPVHSPLIQMQRLDVDMDGMCALFQGRIGEAETAAPGRYRCFGPGEAFIGMVEVHAGKMRALRLVRASNAAWSSKGAKVPETVNG